MNPVHFQWFGKLLPYINPHKALNFGIKSFLQLTSLHIIFFFFKSHNMTYPIIAHVVGLWFIFNIFFELPTKDVFQDKSFCSFFSNAYSYMFEDYQKVVYMLVVKGTHIEDILWCDWKWCMVCWSLNAS